MGHTLPILAQNSRVRLVMIIFFISTGYPSNYFASEFLLVGCENETTITITPSKTINIPNNVQDPNSNESSIRAGSTSHQILLHQRQSLLIKNTDDLTGTKVTSNKPLTVISGHECANVPLSASGCEPIAVQVPAVATWGTEFLLAPFAGRSSNQTFKAISSKKNASFVTVCGDNVTETNTNNAVFTLSTDKYCYVESTSPMLLVQLSPGVATDGKGDPAISMIAPVDQYLNSIEFVLLPTATFLTSFVSITVLSEHYSPNSILLDGIPIDCEWQSIYDIFNTTVGYGCSKAFSEKILDNMPTQHKISHSYPGGLLSVLAYGFKPASPPRGYAYLTGQVFKLSTQSRQPEENSLFDLKTIPGVKELPRVTDAFSDAIYIPGGLIFGSEYTTSAYVNENGVISFDQPWRHSIPDRFPTNDYEIRQSLVIAPFWSDNDIRKAGNVRYVDYTYQKDDSSSPGRKLLDMANQKVQETDMQFNGNWLLIAHWDRVHPSPHGADDHLGISESELEKTNSYQVIIITNNTYTYAIFTYPCGDMQWSSIGANKAAVVGYSAKSDFYNDHFLSGRQNIAFAVSCPNLGRRQKRNYASQNATCGMTEEMNCKDVSDQLLFIRQICNCTNRLDKIDYDINDVLPKLDHCPRTLQSAREDVGRFVRQNDRCYVSGRRVMVNNHSFTQQCCYDNTGTLRVDNDYEGKQLSGSLLLQHPLYETESYESGDQLFKESCCLPPLTDLQDTHCKRFMSERPTNDGSQYVSPKLALGSGDPHYKTFDEGSYYTFNGKGDFVLMELLDERGAIQLTLQGRLGLIPMWSVTTHQGLAFGHSDFALQLTLKPILRVIITKPELPTDITSKLKDSEPWFDSKEEVMVLKRNNEITTTFFKFGTVVIATAHIYSQNNSYFNLIVKLPKIYAGRTRGFFGNLDGDNHNDLHKRGGTTPLTSTNNDTLVLNTMNTWRVTMEESLFMDQPDERKRRQTEENLEFVPIFFHQLNFTDEQIAICEGSYPCLFDLAATGDMIFAGETKETEKVANHTIDILSNSPPSISADNLIRVTLDEDVVYNITVEDPGDEFSLKLAGGLLESSTLEEIELGKYVFRWTPKDVTTKALVFVANDTRGATSTYIPTVHICACVNHGNCTLNGAPSGSSTIVLNCNCNEAFSGRFCEEDRNGCAEIQCFEGVECMDVPAPGIGAMCGPCPLGYTGDGQNKCYDIDECFLNNETCEQTCTNTYGSFTCGCKTGYRLVQHTKCEDINECEDENFNDCQQICENNNGSYSCRCNDGYIISVGDKKSCFADEPCHGSDACSYGCAVINGKEECYCPAGFLLSGTTCVDKNECLTFPCTQLCINTNGSFECNCMSGYELQEDGLTCEDIDECLEAALNSENLCGVNAQCINKEGSFECPCVPGYTIVNETCQRIQNEPPPPTPPVAIPTKGIENSVNYSIATFTPKTFTPKKQQLFKEITVRNINQFCSMNACQIILSNGEVQSKIGLKVEPLNIAIPMSLIFNMEGLHFTFYVQLSDGFLAKQQLQYAVKHGQKEYNESFIPITTTILPTTFATDPVTTTETQTTDAPMTTESIIGSSCAALGFVGCCEIIIAECRAPDGCWCDVSCHNFGDCCEDIDDIGCHGRRGK